MWAFVATFLLLLPAAPLAMTATPVAWVPMTDPVASSEFIRLAPGTPSEVADTFEVPVFVLGEPSGSPGNVSAVRQVWEDLAVSYVNGTPGIFPDWSVPNYGLGRFTLQLVLTDSEIEEVESGQALVVLNSTVIVGSQPIPAAGVIDGAVLSSSILPSTWWSEDFGIAGPPPSTDPTGLSEILADLAWFGDSTAGRALYASMALGAALVYLLEAHKLARSKLLGKPPKKEG
jgi:hypothetical protein